MRCEHMIKPKARRGCSEDQVDRVHSTVVMIGMKKRPRIGDRIRFGMVFTSSR
jgi:hypothetical protein